MKTLPIRAANSQRQNAIIHVESLVELETLAAVTRISLAQLIALLIRYGPVIITIIQDLRAAMQSGNAWDAIVSLIQKHGGVVLDIIRDLFGSTLPDPLGDGTLTPG